MHHAARMGWGVGGRARRGSRERQGRPARGVTGGAGQLGLESSAEEKLEGRGGAAGPGLNARSVTVCRWSAAGQHTGLHERQHAGGGWGAIAYGCFLLMLEAMEVQPSQRKPKRNPCCVARGIPELTGS